MENAKRYKKGDVFFLEGDTSQSVFLIKSGRVSLFLQRSGKKVEIEQLSTSQVVGEQSIFANGKQPYSAEALSETHVLEVPIQVLRTQFDNASAGMKLLVKSLVDGLKASRHALRSFKMELDNSPCPQLLVPKVFSILVLVADHAGKKQEDGSILLDWTVLKIYTARMFLDSPQRMQNLLQLMKKLEYLDLKFEKNEDDIEELTEITIKNVQAIEDFGEFYQYHLYKGGRSEVIYPDAIALQVVKCLNSLSIDQPIDHRGAVNLDYDLVMKTAKENFNIELKTTHFDLLEKKGLFAQKKPKADKVFLNFDPEEFRRIGIFWQIIREIDLWNEKGRIDMKFESFEKAAPEKSICPDCSAEILGDAKFCAQCGSKLAAA